MSLKIKVCGMREADNIAAIGGLPIHFLGFIFHWQFVRFSDMKAEVDETIYSLAELPKILGILQHIIDLQK